MRARVHNQEETRPMGKAPRRLKSWPLTRSYASFPIMLWELIETEGTVPTIQSMARETGLSHGTIRKWLRRDTKFPEGPMLMRFAETYELPPEEVLALVQRDQQRDLAGEPVPMPPGLEHLQRGPRPDPNSKRSKRRRLFIAGGLAACAFFSGGAIADAAPRPADHQLPPGNIMSRWLSRIVYRWWCDLAAAPNWCPA